MDFGPKTSNEILENDIVVEAEDKSRPRLDVAIPVFNPGKFVSTDEEKSWKELRKTESIIFAHRLKKSIEKIDKFGAVRVTPDSNATSDLYILGEILESDSREIRIKIQVVDIAGNIWLNKKFKKEVSDKFWNDPKNSRSSSMTDPYQPLFDKIAEEVEKKIKFTSSQNLEKLKDISNLRFGISLSQESFNEYIEINKNKKYEIIKKLNENDPKYLRLTNLRIRDQMFIDELQYNYKAFDDEIFNSYRVWQQQTYLELEAEDEAKSEALGKALGGILMLGAAVLGAYAAANSGAYDYNTQALGGAAAIGGGIAGASLLKESFKKSEEAKIHRDAINELGQSLDSELSSRVIEFEKETIELTGTAQEQFSQWRNFLKLIYAKEKIQNDEININ
tara:strand:- start:239 stop:1414 length:1176 start_codon:yes stop_codon:yes gene_type:complete